MAGMFDDLIPAQPGQKAEGGGMFDDLIPSAGDQPSFMQRVFDITNPHTGESYIYGNRPDPTGFDDVTRIMQDTGMRGFGSDREKVAAARERTPFWAEIPADITAAVASAPYRIGSTIGGAGIGAAEGALSSYGHQQDWTPDLSQIGWDAAIGAAAGSGGYALPGMWNSAKSGLKSIGAWPKTTTAIADYLFLGSPVVTSTSFGSKAASAVMPKLPENAATRDLLAKSAMGLSRG